MTTAHTSTIYPFTSVTRQWEDWGIKVRKIGAKSWSFVTPRGGTIRLKIHAARFTSNAVAATIVQMTKDNPGYEFKKAIL